MTDASGDVVERYRYTVYGELTVLDKDSNELETKDAKSPFLWGGSYIDDETGLYWMRNRYYNISMKRFINQDPIGIWGDANNLGNGFMYVAGMVVEHLDPTGLLSPSDNLNDWVSDDGYRRTKGAGYSEDEAQRVKNTVKKASDARWGDELNNGISLLGKLWNWFTGKDEKPKPTPPKPEEPKPEEPTGDPDKDLVDPDDSKDGAEADPDKDLVDPNDPFGDEKKEKEEAEKEKAEKEKTEKEKTEKEKCEGSDCKDGKGKGKYPSDPDDSMDAAQKYFMQKALKEMLSKMGYGPRKTKESDRWWKIKSDDYRKGPRGQWIRNPFFRDSDPLKQKFIRDDKEHDGSGRPILKRNPMVRPENDPMEKARVEAWDAVFSPVLGPKDDPRF